MSSPASFIRDKMTQMNYTLSTAESCTVGKCSAALGDAPGCSSYFKGGVVAYTNEIKADILRVQQATLKRYGAVSEEVARQMAEGVQGKFQTTHAVAITGIAGPDGGTDAKPVGTVCFAYLAPNLEETWTKQFSGDRLSVQAQAVQEVLNKLLSDLDVSTIG